MPARRNLDGPSRVRTVRFTDDEWLRVVQLAQIANLKPASYIREKALKRAQRS
jgi:hypothetical protein